VGLKNDASSPVLVNLASEYATEKVQISQDGFKINGTYQILSHTDYAISMGEDINTKKHGNLTVFSKEFSWLKNVKLNELAKFLRPLSNDYVTQSHFIKNYVRLVWIFISLNTDTSVADTVPADATRTCYIRKKNKSLQFT
jgi:hypothetical protein